jgi:hypothetical protein
VGHGGLMSGESNTFWNLQASFWAMRPAARDKAAMLRVDTPVAQRFTGKFDDASFWVVRGEQSEIVRVDESLTRDILELLGEIAPTMANAFDTHMGQLALDAFENWPERSGLSKAMLELTFRTEQGGSICRGSLTSRAPYTPYIKGQPHRKFIEKYGLEVTRLIAEQTLQGLSNG